MYFNVTFNNFLEQSSCAFSWTNKRRDNIKMHGRTVQKRGLGVLQSSQTGSEVHTTSHPIGAGGSLFEGKAAWA